MKKRFILFPVQCLALLITGMMPFLVNGQSYCTPSPWGGDNYIVDVQTTMGVVNISNASDDDSYTDYSATQEVSGISGTSVDFSVSACGDGDGCTESYCKVWVDWNQDGDFTDPGEEVYNYSSGPGLFTFTGSITIPATAITGTTRMRIATDWYESVAEGYPAIGPCVSTEWGEIEDYGFVVIPGTLCETLTINAGTISLPDSVCAGKPFTVVDTGSTLAGGLTRVWQSRSPSGTGAWTTIAGATGVNYTNTAGITEPTDYRCIVTCTASGESDTSNIHTVGISLPSDCYCTPEPGADDNFIVNAKTTLGMVNFDNASGPSSYTDYSADKKVSAVQGTDISIEVNSCPDDDPYWCWESYCKIWVDWNQNGDFTDPGEEVYSNTTGAYTFTGTITVPITATVGTTRMRILTNEAWSGAPMDPCITDYWAGEAEDYAFEVIQATPCDDPAISFPATALAAALPAAVCGTGDVKLQLETAMPVASGITYQWQQSATGGDPWTIISPDLMLPPFDVAGVSADTWFRCVVKCQGSVVLTTNPLLVESVVPIVPALTGGQTCGPGPVELTGDGTGIIYWFENATGGAPLGSGDTFTTPDILTTTTFYAAAGAFPPAEVQIGTGLSSSWTWEGAPFGLGAPSSVGQFMYTAAQLTDAGAISGIIDAMSMNLTSLPEFPIPGYTISIKQVPATVTTLTWQMTGFTTVFGGPGYTFSPAATGWQSFPFGTDFFWDGASNIVVQVCYGPAAGESGGGTHQYTTTTGQMLYYMDWDGGSSCEPEETWDSEQLPNVIFNFPGCISERVPVTAYVRDTPVVTIPIADGEYCVFNNTFDIPSTPEQPDGNTYRWSTGAADSFITVGPSSGIEVQYWVEVTNEWGCAASDTLNIILNPSPVVDLGPDTIVCKGGMVVLDAGSGGVRYYWNTGETTSSIEVDDEGAYHVMVTNEFECNATDTINVTMEGLAPVIGDIQVDNLAPGTFLFTPLHPENVVSYTWNFGDGSPVSTSENPTHTYVEPGTYLVTLEVASDCGTRQYTAYATIFTGMDSPDLEAQDLNVYPNPASGALTIEAKGGHKISSIVVLNAIGQVVVASELADRNKYVLDVSMLASGMYYLKVGMDKGIVIRKFQVLK